MAHDDQFGVVEDSANPNFTSSHRIVGSHVRRCIDRAKAQVQWGTRCGLPSVLLVYNKLDPMLQLFGTEDHDFETAMYGDRTILLDRNSRRSSDLFSGRNQALQQSKNTSFSAVGRLMDSGFAPTVTIFENVFAQLAIPYAQLPPCFAVKRVEVSTEPLRLGSRHPNT